MIYKILKEYQEETHKEFVLVDFVDEKTNTVSKVKEEQEVKHNVLVNNRESAFTEAESKADKEGFVSVTLVKENDEFYLFEFYNEKERKETKGKKGK